MSTEPLTPSTPLPWVYADSPEPHITTESGLTTVVISNRLTHEARKDLHYCVRAANERSSLFTRNAALMKALKSNEQILEALVRGDSFEPHILRMALEHTRAALKAGGEA